MSAEVPEYKVKAHVAPVAIFGLAATGTSGVPIHKVDRPRLAGDLAEGSPTKTASTNLFELAPKNHLRVWSRITSLGYSESIISTS